MLPYILHKRGSNVGHAWSPYAKKGNIGRSTIGNSMQLCLGVPELVGVDPGVPRLLAGSVAQGDTEETAPTAGVNCDPQRHPNLAMCPRRMHLTRRKLCPH